MRIIYKPNTSDDIIMSECASIIMTDDILSYGGCDDNCKGCPAKKIPGLIVGINSTEDDSDILIYPYKMDRDVFVKAAHDGCLDISENLAFAGDELDEILEHLEEMNLLPKERCSCYNSEDGGDN